MQITLKDAALSEKIGLVHIAGVDGAPDRSLRIGATEYEALSTRREMPEGLTVLQWDALQGGTATVKSGETGQVLRKVDVTAEEISELMAGRAAASITKAEIDGAKIEIMGISRCTAGLLAFNVGDCAIQGGGITCVFDEATRDGLYTQDSIYIPPGMWSGEFPAISVSEKHLADALALPRQLPGAARVTSIVDGVVSFT